MQTFQICANTDPLGAATGSFTSALVINGGGVGPVTIPVTFNVSSSTSAGTTGSPLRQLGVFRPTVTSTGAACPAGAAAGTCLTQFVEAGNSNTFDASAKFRTFGLNGDVPVAGDFFGTGTVEIGTFRCAASQVCQWFIDANNNGIWDGQFGGDIIWNFGLPGDIPVVGDWTGDGKAKIGVMRCPTPAGLCTWFLDIGNKHVYDPATVGTYVFGLTGDRPAVGRWATASTNNASQIGIFRCPAGASVCQWVVESLGLTGVSTTVPTSVFSPSDAIYNFGLPGDVPVIGNWNGNGTLRIGTFRPATGQWFLDINGNGTFDPAADLTTSFGLSGDQAIVGLWTN
jgi:hypothetical protein